MIKQGEKLEYDGKLYICTMQMGISSRSKLVLKSTPCATSQAVYLPSHVSWREAGSARRTRVSLSSQDWAAQRRYLF